MIVAAHSDQALAMLGDASPLEETILSAIRYRPNRVILHRDPRPDAAPHARRGRRGTICALGPATTTADVSVTYWMNRLQGIDDEHAALRDAQPGRRSRDGDLVFGEWSYDHPQFDARALSAQARLDDIQGKRRTWFAGAWTGHGFHEDGLRSGLDAAIALGATVPWRGGALELPLAARMRLIQPMSRSDRITHHGRRTGPRRRPPACSIRAR